MNGKKIYKFVITGGPCGGKTTAMEYIQKHYAGEGYSVIIVPEVATELILSGIAPWTCNSNLEYQMCQMQYQLAREEIYLQGAEALNADKIILLCDRGLLDNRAYMTDDEFQFIQDNLNISEEEMLAEYDAVFHLETVAKDNAESYTLDNNGARTETVEEAIVLDDKIAASWSNHPNQVIISSHEDVERKLEFMAGEMAKYLV